LLEYLAFLKEYGIRSKLTNQNMEKKRDVEILVLSDIHLGTRGCHAKELHKYLKTVNPEILILNGDIIDFWQFSKRYWPNSHMKVVKQIIGMVSKGTKTYYITGNHDETLRKFAGVKIGSLEIVNNLVLELDGQKIWFFHGDVFDVIIQYSKWLAKFGAIGYDGLIILNTLVNAISRFFGRGKVSLSKTIKDNIKTSLKYINNFEETAARLAVKKGYDAIVCGHIHNPEIRDIQLGDSKVLYLNSGDWIENLTALEYDSKCWQIFQYEEEEITMESLIEEDSPQLLDDDYSSKQLFEIMLKEFNSPEIF
jgi:UDP-2,3-diacylglucosamine pyrophosphatase LpxH